MHKGRFALVVATSVGFAWAGLVACSSSGTSGTGDVTALPDSGVAALDASTSDTSAPQGDSAVTGQDAAAECGTPAALHPPKGDAGVFCPFSAPAGGKNVYCTVAEQCCENAKGGGVSTCVTKGTACTAGATVWQCEDPSDCPGQKCCAHSGDAGTVTVGTDTCGPFLSKFSGTRCAATCAAGELVVCESQSECATGTCTAVKPKGNDIGVCK